MEAEQQSINEKASDHCLLSPIFSLGPHHLAPLVNTTKSSHTDTELFSLIYVGIPDLDILQRIDYQQAIVAGLSKEKKKTPRSWSNKKK